MDLKEIRNKIDNIDDEILALYLKRMELSKEVGLYKAENGVNLTDNKREREIIYRLAQKTNEDMRLYIKEVYDIIFSTSKAYQANFLTKNSLVKEELDKLVEEISEFPIDGMIACQGIEGANSQMAAEKLFPISNIMYFKNFDGVFNAVEKGFCKFGVLPIENSTAGSVLEVYDLMKKYNFHIVKSIRMAIDHVLAVKKGTPISKIKTIVSHSQALLQCKDYINSLGVEVKAVENTAIGAKIVSESDDDTVAVLCSKDCALIYGLEIVKEKVQNSDKNYTRFICIAKDLKIYSGANKISIMTSLSHTPGSLYKLVSRFYAYGLNLTKIESRPVEGSDFEFMFYFDFEGDILDVQVRNLIAELENGSENFKLLGIYKENLWNSVYLERNFLTVTQN